MNRTSDAALTSSGGPERTHEGVRGTATVDVHGRASAAEHAYAHDQIAGNRRLVLASKFRSRVTVDVDADRDRSWPVLAAAEVVVDDDFVRADTGAVSMHAGVDQLEPHLRRWIQSLAERT